ncbi:MAG: ACT domain-containing protein [bacterium]|nr:ACT domain-containing protein [bacterium]
MNKELIFITVIGKDRKGIVAKISGYLYRKNINIEDIMQKIVNNYFVMAMLVDIKDAKCSLEKISKDLATLGREMNLTIQVQHENIFKMMHRI